MEKTITRFTIDIPNNLHRDFKMLAHQKRKSMRQLALEVIEKTVVTARGSFTAKDKHGTE